MWLVKINVFISATEVALFVQINVVRVGVGPFYYTVPTWGKCWEISR